MPSLEVVSRQATCILKWIQSARVHHRLQMFQCDQLFVPWKQPLCFHNINIKVWYVWLSFLQILIFCYLNIPEVSLGGIRSKSILRWPLLNWFSTIPSAMHCGIGWQQQINTNTETVQVQLRSEVIVKIKLFFCFFRWSFCRRERSENPYWVMANSGVVRSEANVPRSKKRNGLWW